MKKIKKKKPSNDDPGWRPWAEDEFHLVTEKDWNTIRETGRYQGSKDKAAALLTLLERTDGLTRGE